MRIFCDESGGASEGLFIVASIATELITARRLIKDFRKLTKITANEVKGASLTFDQRALFITMMIARDIRASVVVCTNRTQLGGWAFKNLRENEIWNELIVESSLLLAENQFLDLRIFPDGGRYPGATMKKNMQYIEDKILKVTRL